VKIKCGPSRDVRLALKRKACEEEALRLKEWHPHFTLRPRQVAENDCRWLEWIERRFVEANVYEDVLVGFCVELRYPRYRARQ
jgi:hypothetical protein